MQLSGDPPPRISYSEPELLAVEEEHRQDVVSRMTWPDFFYCAGTQFSSSVKWESWGLRPGVSAKLKENGRKEEEDVEEVDFEPEQENPRDRDTEARCKA